MSIPVQAVAPSRSETGLAARLAAGLAARPGALIALFGFSVAYLALRALVFRDAILMSDEYYYAKTSQLWFVNQQDLRQITSIPGRGEAGFPNSLFFWIYQATFLFGRHFYIAAKLLNVLFAALTALAVRSVARAFLSNVASWLIAILALSMPSSSYHAYFMPEALYECCVWWGLATFLILMRRDLGWAAAALGAFLGGALLSKPNAVMLLAASNLVVALVGWRCFPVEGRGRRLVVSLLALNVCFVGVGYLLNLITTGHLAWDPVGKFYKKGLSRLTEVPSRGAIVAVFAKYVLAYWMVVLAVFGPATVAFAGSRALGQREPQRAALMAFIAIGLPILLLGSAKAAVNWEQVFANHTGVYSTRYMAVLFPLVVIGFFDALPRAVAGVRTRRLVGVAIAIAVLALAAAYRGIQNPLQMRELFWPQTISYRLGYIALICALVTTTLYYALARQPRAGVYALLLAGFAAASTVALVRADANQMARGGRAVGNAARLVESVVRPESQDRGFVVADMSRAGSRFMFRFPGIIPFNLKAAGSSVTAGELSPRPDWVVLLGDLRPDLGVACRPFEGGAFCPLSSAVLADDADRLLPP